MGTRFATQATSLICHQNAPGSDQSGQLPPGSIQAGAGGPWIHLELAGDLSGGHPVADCEHQGVSFPCRQPCDQVPKAILEVPAFDSEGGGLSRGSRQGVDSRRVRPERVRLLEARTAPVIP